MAISRSITDWPVTPSCQPERGPEKVDEEDPEHAKVKHGDEAGVVLVVLGRFHDVSSAEGQYP